MSSELAQLLSEARRSMRPALTPRIDGNHEIRVGTPRDQRQSETMTDISYSDELQLDDFDRRLLASPSLPQQLDWSTLTSSYFRPSSKETQSAKRIGDGVPLRHATPETRSILPNHALSSSPARSQVHKPQDRRNPITNDVQPASQSRTESVEMAARSAPIISTTRRQSGSTAARVQLISTRDLPDRFRPVFAFPVFNAMQSKCFSTVYHSDDNFLLASPTGSGKTVIFELAILRLLEPNASGSFKIVYLAPTKALCSERRRDWEAKFRIMNLNVMEMTGESDITSLHAVQKADLVVTTPEKWDSMTRKWRDHEALVRLIKLLLIDEVHILGKDRGSALEAVVSRMKSVGSHIRFIAVSATIPNAQDIATWLGRNAHQSYLPAPKEEFGEEFRPVKLEKHVFGYEGSSNAYQFDSALSKRLPEVISKFARRKPVLIFCLTRASCATTAKALALWNRELPPLRRLWDCPTEATDLNDQGLRETLRAGVAWHHAGLSPQDRAAVELGYVKGHISIICCTSTLAIGVNLPCHLVIIKGTSTLEGSCEPQELSDFEILQMIGRAGRPQFDTEATAVIMTRKDRIGVLENLTRCSEMIESRLHLNLIEHLNAEICLGTITALESAIRWLSSTYLYVRLKADPARYRLEETSIHCSVEQSLEAICNKAMELLMQYDLLQMASPLRPTGYGSAMARYYVSFETMKRLLTLERGPGVSEILSVICETEEFREIHLRRNERAIFKAVNQNVSIRYPFKVEVTHVSQKISLIIQSMLAGIDTLQQEKSYRVQFGLDRRVVLQHARRLIRCVVDCQVASSDGIGIRNALIMVRSLGARVWDDSPLCMLQLSQIGPVMTRKLINNNIKSIQDIASAPVPRLDMVTGRHHPFGSDLQRRAKAFPRLTVSLVLADQPLLRQEDCLKLRMTAHLGFANQTSPLSYDKGLSSICILTMRSDGAMVDFTKVSAQKVLGGISRPFTASFTAPDQSLTCYLSCEEIAGTEIACNFDLRILASEFGGLRSKPYPSHKTVAIGRSYPFRADSDAHTKATTGSDYDEGEIGDGDLAAVDTPATAVHTTDMRFEMEKQRRGAKPSKSADQASSSVAPEWRAERLSNGNWKCRHNCKDKNKCKHECCRLGLESKPKPPKARERADPGGVHKQHGAKIKTTNTGMDVTAYVNQDTLKDDMVDAIDLTQGEPDRPLQLQELRQPLTPTTGRNTANIGRPRGQPREATSEGEPRPAKRRRVDAESPKEESVYSDPGFDIDDLDVLPEPQFQRQRASSQTSELDRYDLGLSQYGPGNASSLPIDSDEEDLLDQALIGAEDSFALQRLSQKQEGGVTEVVGHPSELAGGDLEAGQDRYGEVEKAAETEEELRAFVREQFGDSVEFVWT